MSIKVKMPLIIVFVTAVSILLVAGFGIFTINNQTTQSIDSTMSAITNGYVNKFNGWIEQNAKVAETTNIIAEKNLSAIGTLFQNFSIKSDPDINGIYAGMEDGSYYDGSGWVPPAGYDARTRPWYTGAKKANTQYITAPYIDSDTQKYVVSIVEPITDTNGNFQGAISEDVFITSLVDQVRTIKYQNSGQAFLVASDGTILAHANQSFVNKNIKNVPQLAGIYKSISSSNQGQISYSYKGQNSLINYEKVPSTGWILCLDVDRDVAYAPVQQLAVQYISIAILILIVASVLAVLFSRSLTRPIASIVALFQAAAQGDFTIQLPQKLRRRKDELGTLGHSFDEMIISIRSEAEYAQRISCGDLDFTITEKSDQDVLAISMKKVVNTLDSLTDDIYLISQHAIQGNLGIRGDTQKYEGKYRQMLDGINGTVDAVARPIEEARTIISHISTNNYTQKMEGQYAGNFKALRDDVNTVIERLLAIQNNMICVSKGDTSLLAKLKESGKASEQDNMTPAIIAMMQNIDDLIQEAQRITAASQRGNVLNNQGDAEKFEGGFKEIILGFNETLQGIAAPLQEFISILHAIAVNDFTFEIGDHYQGDYKQLQEAIKDVTKELIFIQNTAVDLAKGDVGQLEHLKRIGKKSEHDKLVPAFEHMMESIKNLIEETTLIANAASSGQLSVRGNKDKFEGGYADVIVAIHALLDAVEKPIDEVKKVMSSISDYELSERIHGDYKGDFKVLADAVNTTSTQIEDIIGKISNVMVQVASGDLRNQSVENLKGDFSPISQALNAILDTMNQLIGQINTTTEQVATGSAHVSQGSVSLAQGTTEQASSLEELTTSIEQLSVQIKDNAVEADTASKLALNANEIALNGSRQMQEMLDSIGEINEASSSISKVIKMIDGLAFQTNILALNAAVEAARAGQSGKGFAVVAEEVRNLASRSAAAAQETSELIATTLEKVESGTSIANQATESFTEITNQIQQIANVFNDIATASGEQATGISQINIGISQVSKVVQTNALTAEESAAASEELSSQADSLLRQVAHFQLR